MNKKILNIFLVTTFLISGIIVMADSLSVESDKQEFKDNEYKFSLSSPILFIASSTSF